MEGVASAFGVFLCSVLNLNLLWCHPPPPPLHTTRVHTHDRLVSGFRKRRILTNTIHKNALDIHLHPKTMRSILVYSVPSWFVPTQPQWPHVECTWVVAAGAHDMLDEMPKQNMPHCSLSLSLVYATECTRKYISSVAVVATPRRQGMYNFRQDNLSLCSLMVTLHLWGFYSSATLPMFLGSIVSVWWAHLPICTPTSKWHALAFSIFRAKESCVTPPKISFIAICQNKDFFIILGLLFSFGEANISLVTCFHFNSKM